MLLSVSDTSRWAPAVTQPAPAFKGTAVHNGEFKEMSLADFKGKYLVLLFYPLDLWVCHCFMHIKHEFVQEYKKIPNHVNIGTVVLLGYRFSFLDMKLPVSRSFADLNVTRGAVLLQHLCVSHRDNRVQWQGQWIPWCQLWGVGCVCGLSVHTPGVDQHTTEGIVPPQWYAVASWVW